MRTVVLGLMAICACGVVLAQETRPLNPARFSLKDDPKLQVPVSFRERYLSLEEFTKRLSRITGALISVNREYAEEKLSLFVKERPAWEVMERATEVLGLEWGEGIIKGSYRITRPTKERREEEAKYRQSIEEARQQILKQIEALQEHAKRDFSEWLYQAEQGDSEGLDSETISILRAGDGFGLALYLFGKWVANWSPREWERFWSGEALFACHPPKPGLPPLPSETPTWLRQQMQKQEAPYLSPDIEYSVYLGITYHPLENQAEYCLIVVPNDRSITGSMTLSSFIPAVSTTSIFSAHLGKIPESLAEVPLEQKSEPALCKARCGIAEQMEWLSARCEVPIVAQAFRRRAWARLNETATNLRDCLKGLEYLARFDFKEGYLLVRYPALQACKYRIGEIPESVISVMESRSSQKEALDLDDYAWFASRLTDEQTHQLESSLSDYLLNFDVEPVVNAIPALRFWASLTDSQKQSVLKGESLSFRLLTPVQQRLYLEALTKTWDCSNRYIGILNHLAGLQQPEVLNQLTFSVRTFKGTLHIAQQERDGFVVNRSSTFILEEHDRFILEGHEDFYSTGFEDFVGEGELQRKSFPAEQITFYFGLNSGETATYYTITLRRPPSDAEKTQKAKPE